MKARNIVITKQCALFIVTYCYPLLPIVTYCYSLLVYHTPRAIVVQPGMRSSMADLLELHFLHVRGARGGYYIR